MSLSKRQELDNPESCINRAADDEPVFVIRAKDPLGAQIVRYWCYLAMTGNVHEREKIEGAWNEAQEFEDWLNRHMALMMEGGPADIDEPDTDLGDDSHPPEED